MTTKSTISPKAGEWRNLELGETLRIGDEWWSGSEWRLASSIGEPVDKADFRLDMRWRRFVPAAKPINYQRLALRMSKAPTIKEARAIYAKAVGK